MATGGASGKYDTPVRISLDVFQCGGHTVAFILGRSKENHVHRISCIASVNQSISSSVV
jgi:hypothetical protein